MPCEVGKCTICGADTASTCPTCGVKTLGSQYSTVDVKWSNGSTMKIGVCVPCATSNAHNKPENKEIITKAHQDYWESKGDTFDRGIVVV